MADPISLSVALGALGNAIATEIAWTVAAEYAISTLAFDAIVYGVTAAVSVIGTSILAPGLGDVQGPRANENQQQYSVYGKFIPIPYGRTKSGGNIIWTTGLREVANTQEVGGKGGGGGGTYTTYTYYSSWAMGISEGRVKEIHKIWFDADLIYNDAPIITLTSSTLSGTVTTSTVIASFTSSEPVDIAATIIGDTNGYYVLGTGANSNKVYFTQAGLDFYNDIQDIETNQPFFLLYGFFQIIPELQINFQYSGQSNNLAVDIGDNNWRATKTASTKVSPIPNFLDKVSFYYGTEDQSPDPNIQAHKGAADTPAYRGLCYIVFDDFELGDWGNRIPTVTVEFSRFPESGVTSEIYPIEFGEDGYSVSNSFTTGLLKLQIVSTTIPDEAMDFGSTMLSGQLREPLIDYVIPDEAMDFSSSMQSGQLRTILLSTTIPDEAMDFSSSMQSGQLRTILLSTTIPDEAMDFSSTMLGGSLT